ncbi:hypothetical protein [Mucilaginibacter sp.]|uniref:hypothetical protein n=1 Tax=Mucilaginibacter sp. TaxID=1882438 RepID=UPI0035BC7AA4
MKIKSISKRAGMLLSAGLIVIVFAQVLTRYVLLPDFVRGAMMGVGIGLQIIALIKLKQDRENESSTENQ